MQTAGNVRKTGRPSQVCTNCRRKKVKCNRRTPCDKCIKSNLIDSCSYGPKDYSFSVNDPSPGSQYLEERVFHPSTTTEANDDNDLNNESPDTPLSRQTSTLFNYQSMEFKKPLFVKKGNRGVEFKSPLSLESIFSNNKQFVKFRSLMPFLFNVEARDSYDEKQKIVSEKELQIYAMTHTQQDIVDLVRTYIVPNGKEVRECLQRFGTELAAGTNYVILPGSVAYAYINRTIDMNRFCDETYMCSFASDPEKAVCFGMIFIILKAVTSITQFEENDKVRNMIGIGPEAITECALLCMSVVRSLGEPTFDELLALLLYRLLYFLNDSVSEHSNATLVMGSVMKLTYHFGIHIRCDHIEGYSEQEVTGIWNVIQFIDAVTSVYEGTLLTIDYRYCIPRLFEYWEPIVLYLRNLVAMFSSVSPISLNEIIDLATSATKLFSVFQTFDCLLNDEVHGPMKYLFSLIVKSDFVVCYQTLMLCLRLSLDEIDRLPYSPTEQELKMVNEMKVKIECQLLYSIILTCGIIKKVTSGEIPHEIERVQLMVAMRVLFSKFMDVTNNVIFSYLSVFNGRGKGNALVAERYTDITMHQAEETLSKDIDSLSLHDLDSQRMIHLMQSVPRLNEYLIDVYLSVTDRNIIFAQTKFDTHFKFLVFVSRLLQNVYEYADKHQTNASDVAFKSDYWKRIIDETTGYFLKNGSVLSPEGQIDHSAEYKDIASPQGTHYPARTASGTGVGSVNAMAYDESSVHSLDCVTSPMRPTFDAHAYEDTAVPMGFPDSNTYKHGKHFNPEDWAFLASTELRDSLGYAASNGVGNSPNGIQEPDSSMGNEFTTTIANGGTDDVNFSGKPDVDEIYHMFFG